MKTKTVKVKDLRPRKRRASGDKVQLADGRWGEVTQNHPTKGGLHFREGQGHFLQWTDDNDMWSGGFFCSEDEAVVEVAS
jgi:hypothetical protein